jgi:hypothetical protein
MENLSAVEQAKKVLREAGYYTDNLWNISDVKRDIECTDEQAQDILDKALSNEWVMEQIWYGIDEVVTDKGLERKN